MARQALVIGVQNYACQELRLQSPHKDAEAMAKELEEADWAVSKLLDPTTSSLKKGILEFAVSARGSQALVYFSGHGTVIGGQQYLLGRDFEPKRRAATVMLYDCSIVDDLVDPLQQCKACIILIDACRGPLGPTDRDVDPLGFGGTMHGSQREDPVDFRRVLIGHACMSMEKAKDQSEEGHSAYTRLLLQNLFQPHRTIIHALGSVAAASMGKQQPSMQIGDASLFEFPLNQRLSLGPNQPLDKVEPVFLSIWGHPQRLIHRDEVDIVKTALLDPKKRLGMIVGAPGAGKTTVAQEAALQLWCADDLPRGIFTVDCTRLSARSLRQEVANQLVTNLCRCQGGVHNENISWKTLELWLTQSEYAVLLIFNNADSLLAGPKLAQEFYGLLLELLRNKGVRIILTCCLWKELEVAWTIQLSFPSQAAVDLLLLHHSPREAWDGYEAHIAKLCEGKPLLLTLLASFVATGVYSPKEVSDIVERTACRPTGDLDLVVSLLMNGLQHLISTRDPYLLKMIAAFRQYKADSAARAAQDMTAVPEEDSYSLRAQSLAHTVSSMGSDEHPLVTALIRGALLQLLEPMYEDIILKFKDWVFTLPSRHKSSGSAAPDRLLSLLQWRSTNIMKVLNMREPFQPSAKTLDGLIRLADWLIPLAQFDLVTPLLSSAAKICNESQAIPAVKVSEVWLRASKVSLLQGKPAGAVQDLQKALSAYFSHLEVLPERNTRLEASLVDQLVSALLDLQKIDDAEQLFTKVPPLRRTLALRDEVCRIFLSAVPATTPTLQGVAGESEGPQPIKIDIEPSAGPALAVRRLPSVAGRGAEGWVRPTGGGYRADYYRNLLYTARALSTVGIALGDAGRTANGQAYLQTAVMTVTEFGEPFPGAELPASKLYSTLASLKESSDPDEAEELYSKALAAREARPFARLQDHISVLEAYIRLLVRRGKDAKAREACNRLARLQHAAGASFDTATTAEAHFISVRQQFKRNKLAFVWRILQVCFWGYILYAVARHLRLSYGLFAWR